MILFSENSQGISSGVSFEIPGVDCKGYPADNLRKKCKELIMQYLRTLLDFFTNISGLTFEQDVKSFTSCLNAVLQKLNSFI